MMQMATEMTRGWARSVTVVGRLLVVGSALSLGLSCSSRSDATGKDGPMAVLSDSDLAVEHEAVVVEPNTGSIPSPCARWQARTRQSEGGALEVVVAPAGTESWRQVLESQRVVGFFWMRRGTASWLVVNHYAVSNEAWCVLYDPARDANWRVSAMATRSFDREVIPRASSDHLHAAAVAASPDGAGLLLRVWGHNNHEEGERYYVVSVPEGTVVSSFTARDRVPREWW